MAETQSWQNLKKHWEQNNSTLNLRELFEADPARFDKFHLKFNVHWWSGLH
jgi:hypothetical protein